MIHGKDFTSQENQESVVHKTSAFLLFMGFIPAFIPTSLIDEEWFPL